MSSFTLSRKIDAPAERVFDLATDLARAAEHISGIDNIEMLTEGPVGLGTRWRETRGGMGTEELTVTAFDPPHGYTAECESCGCHFAATFRFAPVGAATEATLELTTRPITFFAKLMSPLALLMMGGAKKAMKQDLADLQRTAEAQTEEID